MYKIKVLGSSSAGNAIVLYKDDGRCILMDWGLEVDETTLSLIDQIYITHKHGDHTNGMHKQFKRHPYLNIIQGSEFIVPHCKGNDLSELTETFAYDLEVDGTKIFWITDSGRCPMWADRINLSDYDILAIECNYDETIWRNKPEKDFKLQRQMSSVGHLSNLQCLEFILKSKFDQSKNGKILFLHQSVGCSSPTMYDVFNSLTQKKIIAKENQTIYCKGEVWKVI